MTPVTTATATARRRRKNAAPIIEEVLAGTVVSVRFHNPRNGWSVLSFSSNGEFITAVGSIINPREGDEYELRGRYVQNAKYGEQFQFENAELQLPATRKGVIRYLSNIAYGVGPVKAARIVGALGDDCLEKLFKDPGLLGSLGFLTPEQKTEIKEHLQQNQTVAELSGLICGEGITPSLAAKIVRRYGNDAVEIVKENPYRLADDIENIGFLTADKIAMRIGIAEDSQFRVQAAIRHILKEAQNDGHCYLRPNGFVREVPRLLGTDISVPMIAEAVNTLISAETLVRDGDDIYLTEMYYAEVELATKMKALASRKIADIPDLNSLIAKAETDRGITYHAKQREAIAMALTSGLSILTGGPGTGKTEITRAIVDIYSTLHKYNEVFLCSPTGRAAKRLSEATGEEAKTVHRLLGYRPEAGFTINSESQLSPGLLLADEFSMADLSLANSLFSACPDNMQAVLVGDVDQLPSVGPGSVLRDAIDSGAIPVTRLEYIYRQEEGSGISALAHQVNQGIMPSLASDEDVTVIEISSPDEALPAVVKYAKAAYDKYGLMGFGVLAPMHRGSSGVKALNEAIRAALNPGAGKGYCPGDKVMVTKNCYKFDVFNGDLGVVNIVNEDGIVTVDFGHFYVEFALEASDEYAPLDILQLAFASTVHKAQGGEYPACIVVLTRQHYIMLARNLLYTAVTRAKKRLVLIHQGGAVERAVKNNKIAARNSRLAERLKKEGGGR